MNIREYLSSEESVERDAVFCGINPETRALIHKAAGEILASEELLCKLHEIDEAITAASQQWDASPYHEFPRHGSEGEAFLLVFPVLHHVEDIRAFYAKRRIPEQYLKKLMLDLPRWIDTYAERTCGKSGFEEISWLREHISGRLFQIGRLQFQPAKWAIGLTVLKNKQSNELVIVNPPGDKVAPNGLCASCQGVDGTGAHDIVYEERVDGILGHRALPDGRMAFEPEFFSNKEWQLAVPKNSAALNIHIPSGSPLLPDACRQSVVDAVEFFKTYFADEPTGDVKVMYCTSWLLYPDFQKILPADSNIVAFQKMFLPFPLRRMGDWQFYERAFVPYGREVTRDKLKTRLQFALFDHIASGHVPLEGGGVIVL